MVRGTSREAREFNSDNRPEAGPAISEARECCGHTSVGDRKFRCPFSPLHRTTSGLESHMCRGHHYVAQRLYLDSKPISLFHDESPPHPGERVAITDPILCHPVIHQLSAFAFAFVFPLTPNFHQFWSSGPGPSQMVSPSGSISIAINQVSVPTTSEAAWFPRAPPWN